MKKKVLIQISTGDCYDKSVTGKGGKPFTTVDYGWRLDGRGGTYGGGRPCDNEEEVQRSIERYRESIKREGARPVVRDLRAKQTGLMCRV